MCGSLDLGRLTSHIRDKVYLLTKSRDFQPGDTIETILPRLQASVRRMCPDMDVPCVDLFLIHEPVIGPEGRKIMWAALAEVRR
jgi:diketogulonate reductase-like aldo/keto reductase